MSVDLADLGPAYLARCAARVHEAFDGSLGARGDVIEFYLAVGRALVDARRVLSSDQAFGLWFNEQNFGFRKRWALVLRQAAEQESRVRDAVRTRVRTGRSVDLAVVVRTVRADVAREEAAEQLVARATVSPIGGKRPLVEQIERVRDCVARGMMTPVEIAAEIGVTSSHVSNIAKAAGIPLGKTSRLAKADRIERMRVLAREGATSQQIAAEIGVSDNVVRLYAHDHDIEVPADATTRVRRDIDSTRIVSTTIDTIDGIGAMFDYIDYTSLPADQIDGWIDVLNCSIRSLTNLRKQLKEATQP